MIEIAVKNAQQALEYKEQVIAHGLIMGEDFHWSYVPSQYDGWDDSTHTQPMVCFDFADTKLSTFFQLKWGLI